MANSTIELSRFLDFPYACVYALRDIEIGEEIVTLLGEIDLKTEEIKTPSITRARSNDYLSKAELIEMYIQRGGDVRAIQSIANELAVDIS